MPFRPGDLIRFVCRPNNEILLVLGVERSSDLAGSHWVKFLGQRTGVRQCLPTNLFEPVGKKDASL